MKRGSEREADMRAEYMRQLAEERDSNLGLTRWDKLKAWVAGKITEMAFRERKSPKCKCKHCGCEK